jgi:hypothetical protein
MIAFCGHAVTFEGKPAGEALFFETEGGVGYVWKRPDGVSERADWQTAEAAEEALMERVRNFYGAMN